MQGRKLKLLALHSFRTSGGIFREQLERSGLDKELGDLVDIHFIDAPNPASGPAPDDVTPFFKPPYYEWWNAHRGEDGSWSYDGWQQSLSYIEDVLALHGPFDGLIAFSQGAGLASLLVGMQRSGFALQNVPRLRFLVLFAGIRARDPALEKCYEQLRTIPSLHIIGERDPVKGLTNRLLGSFDHPLVITHPKGHVVPALRGEELQRMRAFLEAQRQPASL